MVTSSLILITFIIFAVINKWIIYPHLHLRAYKKSLQVTQQTTNTESEISKTCSLCSEDINNVEKMIAGEKGAVCSSCIQNSLLALDDDSEVNDKYFEKLVLRKISDQSNHDNAKLLINYISSKHAQNTVRLQELINECVDLKNAKLIVTLSELLPRESWINENTLNWIWANIMLGNLDKALDYPEISAADKNNPDFMRHLMLNEISVKLENKPSITDTQKYLAQLQNIEKEIQSSEYPIPQNGITLRPYVLESIAYCHYLLGENSQGLSYLEKAKNCEHFSASVDKLAGDIYRNLDRIDEAKVHWQRALSYNDMPEKLLNDIQTSLKEYS